MHFPPFSFLIGSSWLIDVWIHDVNYSKRRDQYHHIISSLSHGISKAHLRNLIPSWISFNMYTCAFNMLKPCTFTTAQVCIFFITSCQFDFF
jgi:hypothetical protein